MVSALVQRIYTFDAGSKNLLWHHSHVSRSNRLYADSQLYEFTANALWTGAQWQRDGAAEALSVVLLDRETATSWYHRDDASVPWAAWDKGAWLEFFDNAVAGATNKVPGLKLDDDTTADWTYSDHVAVNTLYARNIPKAWAKIEMTALGGPVSILEGFNIASVVHLPPILRITLVNGMLAGTYSCTVVNVEQVTVLQYYACRPKDLLAGNLIDLYFWMEVAGVMTAVDANLVPETLVLNVHVHGHQ
jgi:hypothetical protein